MEGEGRFGIEHDGAGWWMERGLIAIVLSGIRSGVAMRSIASSGWMQYSSTGLYPASVCCVNGDATESRCGGV